MPCPLELTATMRASPVAAAASVRACLVEGQGQREVPQVVGGELQFPAVVGVRLGCLYDAGVVDQGVQWAVPSGGERVDGVQVGQVEFTHVHPVVCGFGGDVVGGAPSGGRIADGRG